MGLGGLTVGYTGSLMSFWEGDFLSTAGAPSRSANTIVYEYEFNDAHKLAVGLESNLPTTPTAVTGLKSFEFSDPVYTARYRYATDDLTLHLSGLARRADFSNSPLLPFFPNTAAVRTGWSGSAGIKFPMNFIAGDDEFNAQWTYAVDASSYLGISTDLTTYQNTVRSRPDHRLERGSVVSSCLVGEFRSNIFGSYVTCVPTCCWQSPGADLAHRINLFWKPLDKVKFGIGFARST